MHSVSTRLLVVFLLIAGIVSGCSISSDDNDGTFALPALRRIPAIGAGDLTPAGTASDASPTPDQPATVEVSPDGERVLTAPAGASGRPLRTARRW